MFFKFTAEHLASVSAFLAILYLGAWPLFRSRVAMLAMQLTALGWLTLHYALVGAMTAAGVNLLGAIQIAVCLLSGDRPRWQWIGYALAGLIVAVGIITWEGFISGLAVIGMAFVALGRAQAGAQAMRVLVLAGTPFWLIHDLLIASPIAIADAISLMVGLWSLIRPAGVPDQASQERHSQSRLSPP
ncbi:YgjV family protein [Dongia sp.]|uniref:YgjV family protein n=1 Tax=Dongia sp. TaxID=1977262 RepID=UPI0035B088D4